MKSETVSFSIDGTSALKIDLCPQRTRTATIIDFPGSRRHARSERRSAPPTMLDAVKARMRGVLESSEMYCSLKFEDLRGFQYNKLNARGIALLSSASAFMAIVSIAVGA